MDLQEKILTRHWLYQWIDEEGIKTAGNYTKAIRKRGAFDRLRELSADQASFNRDAVESRDSIVAGRALDLSGYLTCPCAECQMSAIDAVFSRAWHYFDSIVIDEAPVEDELCSGDDQYDLLQKVKLFLHLRKIGAEKYILFTNKVSQLCDVHFREHAEKKGLGLDALFDRDFEEEVVRKLVAEARLNVFAREELGAWGYEVTHPDIGKLTGTAPHSDMSNRPTKSDIARMAFGKCCAGLISDVSASRTLGVPLLQAAETTWLMNAPSSEDGIDEREVALYLTLPVLTHVPIKEILKFREDNWASFEQFRSALRTAIREQIDRRGAGDPKVIADRVTSEIIKPELARIEVELTGVKKTLSRKINAHIAVAGSTVTVGAVGHVPLLIAATAAAAAASIAQIINKNADNKQAIEADQYYFLWRAHIANRR
jgi:Family of unknown function (DUF6236)